MDIGVHRELRLNPAGGRHRQYKAPLHAGKKARHKEYYFVLNIHSSRYVTGDVFWMVNLHMRRQAVNKSSTSDKLHSVLTSDKKLKPVLSIIF